ncbi:PEP-CTERM sorting domain-containing protein [Pseudorhodoferax sp. Leaf267]|uniref:PEP-CTERM sorting domain-containing protein n=1 Tax=Pseudorhodoferax sp. Leaf267 TaxID=1736316 RepID=UPI0006F73D1B|nr:PEP-CTERM sorting domain-containing protein [Pseudorhodoferax sp. Leaf267]KQP23368.1 hypothetical protein ASF43_05785 [Pseudorhodoferax sp. Leaf267]
MKANLLYSVLLVATLGTSHANVVTSDACALGARDFSVTANSVVSCLAAGAGNINGNNDAFQQANPGWIFVDGSDNNGGAHNGWLTGSPSLTSGLSGTFTINALAYSTYDRIAIGFKSGEGQLNPDWAVFELADNTFTGTWSISGQQQLSHALLYGIGTPTLVPEPGSLVLIGLGLAGLAAVARRRTQG